MVSLFLMAVNLGAFNVMAECVCVVFFPAFGICPGIFGQNDPRVRGRWLKANVLPLLDLTETTRPCFAFRLSLWHLSHVSMLFRDEMYCNLFLLKNNV